jgi:phosphoglycolate phosphatase
MKQINLIFDLDGTLVDSIPGIEGAIRNAVYQTLGVQKLPDLRPLIGPPIRTIIKRIFPKLHELEITRIEEKFREIYDNEGWKSTYLYPGVMDALQTLRLNGNSLYVATNKPLCPTNKILNELKLAPLLTSWVCRDSKQPPFLTKLEVLNNLIGSHKMIRKTTYYIGDQPEDFEVALPSGILFIGVTYGYGDVTRLKKLGCLLIDRLEDLIPVLNLISEVT